VRQSSLRRSKARLIILLLCAWGLLPQPLLYLSAFFEAHRQEYYRLLLAVSQRGAWEAWLSFFLEGIAGQSRDATARAAARLQSLRESYRERMQHQRAVARLLEVVDLLFARPIVQVPDLAGQIGVSQQTAGRYVATLEAAGILRETTGQARNRVYMADAVYEAITSPTGGEAA
jgi:Fic family protein